MRRRDFLVGVTGALSTRALFGRDRAAHLHQEALVINCHDHMRGQEDYADMIEGGMTVKIYKPMADGIYWDESNRRVFPKGEFD